MYDKDGFYVLISTGKPHRQYYRGYGEHSLISTPAIPDIAPSRNQSRYRVKTHLSELETGYAPKTWQNKAWRLIGKDIDWSTKSQFGEAVTKSGAKDTRLHHIKRIGMALKVRVDTPYANQAKPTIDQLSTNNSRGMYAIADTISEFRSLLNQHYKMIYTNLEKYLSSAEKMGFDEIVYISKVMIIYDDKTFDVISGDPRYIQEFLNLDFTEGGKLRI